jgi:hypothetical protein
MARKKPRDFLNHRPVLAVSIGGTNSKLMIASTQGGHLTVDHIKAVQNPLTPIPFEHFFDDFLLRDEKVMRFLRETSDPCIGFSIPVPMPIEGVFSHISKVGGITGLIARDLKRDASSHHFGKNFRRFLKARNLTVSTLFYYSDTVIAHHGAMSICPLTEGDKSVLLVSGTGMATGDEGNFVLTCWAPLLDTDEELYPRDVTEGYQYQFCSAGKGIFSLMNRSIRLRARERDSFLSKYDLTPHFQSSKDSKTVVMIWESTLPGGKLRKEALEIFQEVGPEAFSELQWIACLIMGRAVSAIANSAVGTFIHMGPPENGHGHILFFEGSIVKNIFVLPRIKEEIVRLIAQEKIFEQLGLKPLPNPVMEPDMTAIHWSEPLDESHLKEIDYTLIGSATAVIAESCLPVSTYNDID